MNLLLNLGVIELLGLILVAIFIILMFRFAIRRMSFLEAWIVRRAEARAFERGKPTRSYDSSPRSCWWLIVPVVTAQVGAIGLWVFLSELSDSGFRSLVIQGGVMQGTSFLGDHLFIPSNPVVMLNQLLVPLLLATALILHFWPYTSRLVKYGCVLSALVFLWSYQDVFSSFYEWWDVKRIGDIGVDRSKWDIVLQLSHSPAFLICGWFFVTLGLSLLNQGGTLSLRRRSTRQLYRLISATGSLAVIYMLVIASVPITRIPILPVAPLVFYVVLRFLLVEQMSAEPIIYMRSFKLPEIATAFGKIVAPAASRFGVLVGLSHPSQGMLEVFTETPIIQRARLDISSDDTWKSWVCAQLERSWAVVIDLSRGTEGVSWELSRAIEIVPTSRIAVMQKKLDKPVSVDELWTLHYTLDPVGVRDARKALRGWLRGILQQGA